MPRRIPLTLLLHRVLCAILFVSSVVYSLPAVTATGLEFDPGWRAQLAEGQRLLKTKQLEEAEVCFRQAYKDVKHTGAKIDDIVICMQSLAKVLYMQDQVAETLPLYKKSLRMLAKAHGKDSMEILPTLIVVGGIYEAEGDYKKAGKYYRRADRIAAKQKGTDSMSKAGCQHLLGRIAFKQGLTLKAEEYYLSALEEVMGKKARPSADFLEELLIDYFNCLLATDGDGRAYQSSFQSELLKDRIGSLASTQAVAPSVWSKKVTFRLTGGAGSDTDRSAVSPSDSSGPLEKRSDSQTLEKINNQRILFYERMIATDIDSLGAEHPSVARDLTGLASIYLSSRNYHKARPLLERALRIYENTYKTNAAPVKHIRLLLTLIRQTKAENAPKGELSYLKNLPQIPLAAQNLAVALRLNDLAFICYCQGKTDTSLKLYYWAAASTAHAAGENSPLAAACITDLSMLLRMKGKVREAQAMKRNARIIFFRSLAEKRSRMLP